MDVLYLLKLLILFVLLVTLSASAEDNKAELDIKFKAAKKLFLKKEYKAAYEKFYTIFLNNLGNPNVNFYLGQSAFMLKNFNEAISAYERILFIDENAIRVRLELARSHMGNGSYDNAKAIFTDILKQETLPSNVKENIKRYLQAIEDKDVKNTINGVLIVGFGWDDNVESLSTGFVSDVTDVLLVSTNSLVSVWTHQEALAVTHIYKYSDTVNFKNDALFYNKGNIGFSQRDIQLVQYSPAISVFYNNKFNIDYSLVLNRIWLDKKPLLSNYAINPKIKYLYSKSLIFGMSLKYQQKFNEDNNNRARDSVYSELAFNAQTIHSDKISSLTELKIARERKIR